MNRKDNSEKMLAVVLIAAGIVWLFKKAAGISFFQDIYLPSIFFPFRHIADGILTTLFSWQIILIITGLLLLAGRRSSGIILMVLGSIFLLPEILHLSFFSFSFLVPAALITVGIILISKASTNLKQ